jgi:hypothetical protein
VPRIKNTSPDLEAADILLLRAVDRNVAPILMGACGHVRWSGIALGEFLCHTLARMTLTLMMSDKLPALTISLISRVTKASRAINRNENAIPTILVASTNWWAGAKGNVIREKLYCIRKPAAPIQVTIDCKREFTGLRVGVMEKVVIIFCYCCSNKPSGYFFA